MSYPCVKIYLLIWMCHLTCDLKSECLSMHVGKIYIIDYEYGSYIYRGYDIANHFNEHAGFKCGYNLYVFPSLTIFLMYMCM